MVPVTPSVPKKLLTSVGTIYGPHTYIYIQANTQIHKIKSIKHKKLLSYKKIKKKNSRDEGQVSQTTLNRKTESQTSFPGLNL